MLQMSNKQQSRSKGCCRHYILVTTQLRTFSLGSGTIGPSVLAVFQLVELWNVALLIMSLPVDEVDWVILIVAFADGLVRS